MKSKKTLEQKTNRNNLIYVFRWSGNLINTTKQQIRNKKNGINILIGLYRYRSYYRYIDRYVRVLNGTR